MPPAPVPAAGERQIRPELLAVPPVKRDTLIALQSGEGPCFLAPDRIVYISAPFQKHKHAPSRTVGLEGGTKAYIYDSPANYAKLRHLLPSDAPALEKEATANRAPVEDEDAPNPFVASLRKTAKKSAPVEEAIAAEEAVE